VFGKHRRNAAECEQNERERAGQGTDRRDEALVHWTIRAGRLPQPILRGRLEKVSAIMIPIGRCRSDPVATAGRSGIANAQRRLVLRGGEQPSPAFSPRTGAATPVLVNSIAPSVA
jgi:hypothetical protein